MTGKKFLRQFQREYARVFLASLLNLIEESARYHFALGELWIIRIGANQLAIYISFAVSNVFALGKHRQHFDHARYRFRYSGCIRVLEAVNCFPFHVTALQLHLV